MHATMTTNRYKFQFSNPRAQAAEAHLNAKETLALCERWVPQHLKDLPEPETTRAGACFRNVTRILKGRGP